MMNTHDEAPFSIGVALPTHLKSLVERMLHGLLREQPHQAARWLLSDAADTDVTLRLHGENGQAISPDLLADVRRRDGRRETVVIEGAWRAGAMTAALDGIAAMIARSAAPATPPSTSPSALARQWLQRWCELRTQNAFDAADLNIGERTVARMDLRSATARYVTHDDRADAATLVAAMARGGWELVPRHGDVAAIGTGVSMKPLLWQLGLLSGEQGTLPALRAAERLRLKGWPYLAAGGHASFAELIKHLRNGDNDRTSLQALGIAPRTVVDGFLNACFVCDFFHDPAATAPSRAAPPPPPRNDAADRVVVSALRRTLGIARP